MRLFVECHTLDDLIEGIRGLYVSISSKPSKQIKIIRNISTTAPVCRLSRMDDDNRLSFVFELLFATQQWLRFLIGR